MRESAVVAGYGSPGLERYSCAPGPHTLRVTAFRDEHRTAARGVQSGGEDWDQSSSRASGRLEDLENCDEFAGALQDALQSLPCVVEAVGEDGTLLLLAPAGAVQLAETRSFAQARADSRARGRGGRDRLCESMCGGRPPLWGAISSLYVLTEHVALSNHRHASCSRDDGFETPVLARRLSAKAHAALERVYLSQDDDDDDDCEGLLSAEDAACDRARLPTALEVFPAASRRRGDDRSEHFSLLASKVLYGANLPPGGNPSDALLASRTGARGKGRTKS